MSAAAIVLLAGLGFWLWTRGKLRSDSDLAGRNHAELHEATADSPPDGTPRFRTKASQRGAMPAKATHSPERLGEFILPPLVMDGLTLQESLGELLAAYQDACLKSGETPLPLTFSVAPEAKRRLHVRLKPQSFRTSVRMLATLAGMHASRSGLDYRFEPLAIGGKSGKASVKGAWNFSSVLNEMVGTPPDPTNDPFSEEPAPKLKNIAECLATLGLELDPSTRLSLSKSGELTIDSASAADAAAISALADLIASETVPQQMKFTAKVVELKADMDWTAPDLSQMNVDQLQLLMRDLSLQTGAVLKVMPSVVARNEQDATIEIIREVIYPTNDAGNAFEKRNVGQVMNIRGGLLGFGQDVTFCYSDTTVEGFEPANAKKPIFNEWAKVGNSGFTSDGGTRFSIQTRPDGSKTLVLLTSEQIDNTGRAIRGK